MAVAALITDRLSRPVRSLASAMLDVQQGNLNIQLPVSSTDEVGRLTDAFNFFVKELRSKEHLKQTFGKYIDPRILEHMIAEPGAEPVASGRREMTVLFADLVGFTNLSERFDSFAHGHAAEPALWFAGLRGAGIPRRRGQICRRFDYGVLGASFVKADEHATMACRAAQAQLRALDTLRRELPQITGLRRDAPVIELCLGICTGEVIVGNIGSENTRSYTVIGDTVNVTARLERANRVYGTQILT